MIAEPTTEPADGRRLLSAQELAEAGLQATGLIALDLVDPSPQNPREHLPEVPDLAANIARFGLMQAIFVRRNGERYEVISGHRRRAAYLWLREQHPFDDQWRAIPAVVVTADDDTATDMLVSAQVHVANWKPREQAAALERYAMTGMSLAEIGGRVNRSEAWASKRLRVFADSVLSGYVQSGQLSTGVAEEFLQTSDIETRKRLAERAVVEGWSQDKARAEVRALRLDRQITDLGRRGLELLDILSRVRRADVPISIFRDLMVLLGRLESLKDEAIGPRMPSIEEAERVAGVSPAVKARAAKRAQDRRRETRRRKKT